MTDEIYDIAILGAGPIGLEAALRAADEGYKTIVIERGEIGQNVRDWGHVKLFSPFGMNSSERGRAAAGCAVDFDECQTGYEFRDQYLLPLSRTLSDRVEFKLETEVWEVRRHGWTKTSGIGSPQRAKSQFCIQCATRSGETWFGNSPIHARTVLDTSGVTNSVYEAEREVTAFSTNQPVGTQAGGAGVRGPLSPQHVEALANASRKRVAVVGSGYTAATDTIRLADAGVNVTWLTRGFNATPLSSILDDVLPQRDHLVQRSNALVETGVVEWVQGVRDVRVTDEFDDVFGDPKQTGVSLHAETLHGLREWGDSDVFDQVVIDVGFRPNVALFRELHVHLCYATEGPIKLAAKLLGESGGDCLTQSGSDASLLVNPEPNFFILGAKSYGRNSNFLIRAGIEQVNAVFDELLPETLWPLIGREG